MRTADLPLIELPNDPRGRGRAHGEALRGAIAAKVERWHEAIAAAYGQAPAPFLARFLAETDFRPAIAAHTPELLPEIEGLAEGAAIAPETAFALQLMDEEWWFGTAPADGHCSGFALAAAGRTLMGQTMDLPAWHDGSQALLRLAEADGSRTLVLTSAGMLGLLGLSSRGFGLCVNTLIQLARSPRGLPVACTARGALAAGGLEAAATFLRRVPHASGQNYLLGEAGRALDLECSAEGALQVAPTAPGCLLHTNHPLARHASRLAEDSENSRRRLASLEASLRGGTATVEDAMRALAARAPGGEVSVEPSEKGPTAFMTFAAVVFELGPTPACHIAAGPPSRETWVHRTPTP